MDEVAKRAHRLSKTKQTTWKNSFFAIFLWFIGNLLVFRKRFNLGGVNHQLRILTFKKGKKGGGGWVTRDMAVACISRQHRCGGRESPRRHCRPKETLFAGSCRWQITARAVAYRTGAGPTRTNPVGCVVRR